MMATALSSRPARAACMAPRRISSCNTLTVTSGCDLRTRSWNVQNDHFKKSICFWLFEEQDEVHIN